MANKQKPSRRWNGRQIKNAFQTAIALATWDYNDGKDGKVLERPKVTDKHFSIVSQTSAHFDDYLSATHQIDEDETYGVLAQREGLRNDNVPRINLESRGSLRGTRRDSSIAKSRSSRRRNGRNNYSRKEASEDEEDDDNGRGGSGGSGERTDVSDEDDAEMRVLERKLQGMRRKKRSSKGNRRKIDEAEEAENDGRSSHRRGKTTQKESSRSNLAPETRSRKEMAKMEEDSEEKSDED